MCRYAPSKVATVTGRHPAHAVAVTADRSPVHGADLPGPLFEEDTGRHEAQRAQLRPLHGGKRQPRLAAPDRERDHTSSMRQFPRRQRGLLVGAEIDGRPRLRHGSRTRRKVLDSDATCKEPALEGRVPAGGRAIRADATVPQHARCGGEVQAIRWIGQHDGPSVKSQLHDRRASAVRAHVSPRTVSENGSSGERYRALRGAPMPKDGYTRVTGKGRRAIGERAASPPEGGAACPLAGEGGQ